MQDTSNNEVAHNPMEAIRQFAEEYRQGNQKIVKVKTEKMEGTEQEDNNQEGWTKVKSKSESKREKKKYVGKKSDGAKNFVTKITPIKERSPTRRNRYYDEDEFDRELKKMDIYGVDQDSQETERNVNEEAMSSTNETKPWADYSSDEDDELLGYTNLNMQKQTVKENKWHPAAAKRTSLAGYRNTKIDEGIIEEDVEESDQLKKPGGSNGDDKNEEQKDLSADEEMTERNKSENKQEQQNEGENDKEENKEEDKETQTEEEEASKSPGEEGKEGSLGSKQQADVRSYAERTKAGLKPKLAKNTVRYRCTLKFQEEKAEIEHIKDILVTAMELAKDVDPDAQLVTLDKDAPNIREAIEINRLDRETIFRYIDWRVDRNEVRKLKLKHIQNKIGIRFTYNIHPIAFLNKWKSMRKICTQQKRKHFPIRLDKVQNGTKAYQVGMFMGTSKTQNIERIQKELEAATGIKGIEVSYQDIYQKGVTEELWAKMYKKADVYSRYSFQWYDAFHKNAPRALMVYVQDPNQIESARQVLRSKFQQEVEGQWPKLPDGSPAKFVPLKGSELNEKVQKQVLARLTTHVELNDQIVHIPVGIRDLDTKYKEMNGKSMRDILHELVAESVKDKEGNCAQEPLIRHVCDEWSPNPSIRKYSVAVFGALAKEAGQKIDLLRDSLEQVFPEASSVLRKIFNDEGEVKRAPMSPKKRKSEDDWFDNDSQERYANVKIEGLDLIRKEELPSNNDKNDSTIGDLTSNMSLNTIQTTDKTVDTTAGDSEEVEEFSKRHKISSELVRKRLAQVKVKLVFLNEFKDRKDDLEKILRMQVHEFMEILEINPIYWQTSMMAEQIRIKYKKIQEDLGANLGKSGQ